jgi:hypothetical protein
MNKFSCRSCITWLQIAVQYVAAGYGHWAYTLRPVATAEAHGRTDRKLLAQYPEIGLSKWARARRKKKGLDNLVLLRWERHQLLLANGREGVTAFAAEPFKHLASAPPVLPMADGLEVRIYRRPGGITVKLTDAALDALWERLELCIGNLGRAQALWRWIDSSFPSWSGIYTQKKVIRRRLVREARAQGNSTWCARHFPIYSRRVPRAVYKDAGPKTVSVEAVAVAHDVPPPTAPPAAAL